MYSVGLSYARTLLLLLRLIEDESTFPSGCIVVDNLNRCNRINIRRGCLGWMCIHLQ